MNNANYFKNNVVEASAHYFVDSESITRSVPDDFVAWHCGALSYRHHECRNANSIGVEICDDVKNGVICPSDKTIKNTIELVEWLMKKYNIPKVNVIRHYDVTGKLCPAYWCGTIDKEKKWQAEFKDKLNKAGNILYRVQVGVFSVKANAERLKKELESKGYNAIIKES